MAGLSASGLKTQIRSYTETDSNVLSDSVLENIILNAQYRIFRDANVVGGVAAATINLAAGYVITKVDNDNYTFATSTTSSITETGGGGSASAGPVTITAWLKK